MLVRLAERAILKLSRSLKELHLEDTSGYYGHRCDLHLQSTLVATSALLPELPNLLILGLYGPSPEDPLNCSRLATAVLERVRFPGHAHALPRIRIRAHIELPLSVTQRHRWPGRYGRSLASNASCWTARGWRIGTPSSACRRCGCGSCAQPPLWCTSA